MYENKPVRVHPILYCFSILVGLRVTPLSAMGVKISDDDLWLTVGLTSRLGEYEGSCWWFVNRCYSYVAQFYRQDFNVIFC